MHHERLHLQPSHEREERLAVAVADLHGADVGEDRNVRGGRLDVEMWKELGILEEHADGAEPHGNAQLLRRGGELLLARKPPSEPPVMQEMNKGMATRAPEERLGGVDFRLGDLGQRVVGETNAFEPCAAAPQPEIATDPCRSSGASLSSPLFASAGLC